MASSSCADEHAKNTGPWDELLENAVIAFADLIKVLHEIHIATSQRDPEDWST